jgi:hypothetical protein
VTVWRSFNAKFPLKCLLVAKLTKKAVIRKGAKEKSLGKQIIKQSETKEVWQGTI